jgi:cystathionine beta-synthase
MIPSACGNVLAAIGETPIVALRRLGRGLPGLVYGKCEFMNPGGSIKDRIGAAMIERAEQDGLLCPGGTIVEATAGNTGMSLAMVAASRGYRMLATIPSKMSREKIGLIRAFGAEVEICPYDAPPHSPSHYINRARAIAAEMPGGWFADQFNNPANADAHYRFTGPEIWRQCGGTVNAIVGGIGTGGTLAGIAAFLKERDPAVRIILADPVGSIFKALVEREGPVIASSYLVEGIGGDFVPGVARLDLVDEAISVGDEEAISVARRVLREEGLFVGASSGCILAAALRYAAREGSSAMDIIALLPDGGRSYLSTIYNPDWLAERSLAGADACTGTGARAAASPRLHASPVIA